MHREKRKRLKKMVFVVVIASVFFISLSASAQKKDAEDASEPPISLNVNQMEVHDVLRLIAEQANLNIIIDKRIEGEITLRVKDASLWQVLEVILSGTGFTYQKKNEIIIIVELEETEEGTSEEELFSATEIIFLTYARSGEVQRFCQRFLSPSGIIEVNSKINALIITDIRKNIKKIQQLMAKLDVKPFSFSLSALGGIIFDSECSLAIINGKIVRLGETIEDFTVNEIGQDTVTLKRGNQVVVLKL